MKEIITTINKFFVMVGGLFLLMCMLAFIARIIKVIYFGF